MGIWGWAIWGWGLDVGGWGLDVGQIEPLRLRSRKRLYPPPPLPWPTAINCDWVRKYITPPATAGVL